MTDKMKIKVIKKAEAVKTEAVVKAPKVSKKVQAREMVSTVTTWVSEFQMRKREETKVAFEQLFATRTQPSES